MNTNSIDTEQYENQLEAKIKAVNTLFSSLTTPELEIFKSPEKHYRMRAEFRVWHEADALYYVMFDPKTKEKYRVEKFLPAHQLIDQLMPELIELIKPNPLLRSKLFQIDFLATLSGEILVSLLYHRALEEAWIDEAHQLKSQLESKYNIHLIGRSRKQKIVIDQDFVTESLTVNGQVLQYQQIENSFTQPNAIVNIKMLEWAQDVTQNSQGDLLELYCGNGNFSIALADQFENVLATEISKSSVQSAQINIQMNRKTNVKILRLSAEEFTQAIQKHRTFKRLEGIDLQTYNCTTILVDPPRCGLDNKTIQMIQDYDKIVYISCDPNTLKSNLESLNATHKISRMALFDQFPYTKHIETGVYLEKR